MLQETEKLNSFLVPPDLVIFVKFSRHALFSVKTTECLKKFAKIRHTNPHLGTHLLGVQGVLTYLFIDFLFLTSNNTCIIIGYFQLKNEYPQMLKLKKLMKYFLKS